MIPSNPYRQHMERIATRLAGLGSQNIQMVDWPEAPPKGDAAAVAQGVDVRRLIANATVWKPGNVDLGDLLHDVVIFIRQYVVLTEHQLWALALWIAHTHALDAADCTPYLSVKSAEKQSGKTLFLEVLNLLVARPWFTGRVTAAVLVRKVARDIPTLLLDETDTTFKGDKEYSETLRGVLDSRLRGRRVLQRSSQMMLGGLADGCPSGSTMRPRSPGQRDFERRLRDFPVFGAKALAGIGMLPDTVQDRSIPIEMRRKTRMSGSGGFGSGTPNWKLRRLGNLWSAGRHWRSLP